MQKAIVYKAEVTTNDNVTKEYIGNTEPKFKERLANHKQSFIKSYRAHETKLSSYIWSKKKSDPNPKVQWSIVKKSQPYRTGSRSCNLCTQEKLEIFKNLNNPRSLNGKNELVSRCPHSRSHRLAALRPVQGRETRANIKIK